MKDIFDNKDFNYSDYSEIEHLAVNVPILTKACIRKHIEDKSTTAILIVGGIVCILIGASMFPLVFSDFCNILFSLVYIFMGLGLLYRENNNKQKRLEKLKKFDNNNFLLIKSTISEINEECNDSEGPNAPGEGWDSYVVFEYYYKGDMKVIKNKIHNMAKWKVLENRKIYLMFFTAGDEIDTIPTIVILGQKYEVEKSISFVD